MIRDKASNIQDILDEDEITITKAIRERLTNLLDLINEDNDQQMQALKKELEYLLYEENKSISN